MSLRLLVRIAALAILAAGAVVLLLPIRVSADFPEANPPTETAHCGTGLIAENYPGYVPAIVSRCDSAIGVRRAIGWPLAGVGVVVLSGTLLIRRPTTVRAVPESAG